MHEPKSAPGNDLSCVFWAQEIRPARSGLSATSISILVKCRLYSNMLQEPQDAIDPNLMAAAAVLMNEYSTHFTFSGTLRNIDLLGSQGQGLFAQAGYLNQDNRIYRVYEIDIPMIFNDAFAQVA